MNLCIYVIERKLSYMSRYDIFEQIAQIFSFFVWQNFASLTNDRSCEMHLRVDLSTIALQIFGASTSNCKIPDLRYQMNQFNYLLLELSK